MEELCPKILIKHIRGADIASIYSREAFDLLGLEKESYDHSQFIEVDTEFEYMGNRFRVEEINFKFYKKNTDKQTLLEISENAQRIAVNCQICLFVDYYKAHSVLKVTPLLTVLH